MIGSTFGGLSGAHASDAGYGWQQVNDARYRLLDASFGASSETEQLTRLKEEQGLNVEGLNAEFQTQFGQQLAEYMQKIHERGGEKQKTAALMSTDYLA